MSFFEKVEQTPADPIFGLELRFLSDSRPFKVNLGAGIYKTAELKPLILNSVKEAEFRILQREKSKDYLPIDGMPEFVDLTMDLVFGKKNRLHPIYGAQTTGGTGALRVGGVFLKEAGFKTLYLSDPTWGNHARIFNHAGLDTRSYPYYDWDKKGFDCNRMIEAIFQMEERSVILLHACCHNPTGCDPSLDQWKEIFRAVQKKKIFPFFDFAYQGFGDGLEEDAHPLHLWIDSGSEYLVATSYAKNFGIYAERCGALFVGCQTDEDRKRIGSKIKVIIRGLYSNPPCHGGRIVTEILGDEKLRSDWEKELDAMRARINGMRTIFAERLGLHDLTSQKGMFSYTGLQQGQVEKLIANYGVYLPNDGRINLAGLNDENLNHVIDSFSKV